jgi:GNAT superfamily N-acetyltransferase
MKTTYTINRAREEDRDECVGMLAGLFALERDFNVNHKAQARGFTMLLASPHAYIAIARMGTSVVGMITAQLVVSTSEGGYSIWVEDLYVKPEKRNKGIGSALLDEIMRWGKKMGVKRYQLVADRNNSYALGYYKKQGWTVLHLAVLRRRR